MNKTFKIFVFSLILNLVEAVALTIIVLFLTLITGVSSKPLSFLDLIFYPVFFMLYKTALESCPFLLSITISSWNQKIKFKDLVVGKIVSAMFMMLLLSLVVIETSKGLDIFTIYLIAFLPSILISYLMTKKWWEKSLQWVNR